MLYPSLTLRYIESHWFAIQIGSTISYERGMKVLKEHLVTKRLKRDFSNFSLFKRAVKLVQQPHNYARIPVNKYDIALLAYLYVLKSSKEGNEFWGILATRILKMEAGLWALRYAKEILDE